MTEPSYSFEEITDDELQKELESSAVTGRAKKKKFDTDDRSQTAWFRLPHIMGFCTVPTHDELQKMIVESSEDARVWREQKYPNRMTYLIDPYHVCRDCYVNSEDILCRKKELAPKEFGSVDAT